MSDSSLTGESALREAMDDAARQRGLGAVVAEARLSLKQRSADVNWVWVATAVVVVGVLALDVIGGSSQVLHLVVLAAVIVALGYLLVRAVRSRARGGVGSGAGSGAARGARSSSAFRGVQIARALEGGAIWGVRDKRGAQQLRVYTWPEITRLLMVRLETRHTAGVLSHTSVQHALQVDQEGLPSMAIRRVGTNKSQELTRVALAIEERHTAYVVAAALDALRAGRTYSFGPAEVGPDGVTMLGELTPWSQLADVRSLMPYVYGSATARSEVYLVRHDRKRTRAVPHQDLSSARAFFEVLERVVTTPR